jgi:hypothetical protein
MPDRRALSHKALGITEAEHRALLEVRELFAKGTFHHDAQKEFNRPDGFNMDCHLVEEDCGTTGCIGGWMWAAMSRDRTTTSTSAGAYVNRERSAMLHPLFYPFKDASNRDIVDDDGLDFDFPYELIPPTYALKAIDNFLATGNPDWPTVCGLRNLEVHPNAA